MAQNCSNSSQARPTPHTLKWYSMISNQSNKEYGLFLDNQRSCRLVNNDIAFNRNFEDFFFSERKWCTISCFQLLLHMLVHMDIILQKNVPSLENIVSHYIVKYCQNNLISFRRLFNNREEVPFPVHRDVQYYNSWSPLFTTLPPTPIGMIDFVKVYGFIPADSESNTLALLPHENYFWDTNCFQFYRVIVPDHGARPFIINFACTMDELLRVEFVDLRHLHFRTHLRKFVNKLRDDIRDKLHPALLGVTINNMESLNYLQMKALARHGHLIIDMINHGYNRNLWRLQDPYEITYTRMIKSAVETIPADLSPYNIFHVPSQYLGIPMELPEASDQIQEGGWYAHGHIWEKVNE